MLKKFFQKSNKYNPSTTLRDFSNFYSNWNLPMKQQLTRKENLWKLVWQPHRLIWTWSPYGIFCFSEKYTYSRVKNHFLPHKWRVILLQQSPTPSGPFATFFVIEACSIPLDPFSWEGINEKCPRIIKTKIWPPLAHLHNSDSPGGALGSPKTSQNNMFDNIGM